MEDKLFDLVGLGVPFYLAAATYGVFTWLDSNASDEATQVISSWLRGHSHDKPDLGNLIIKAFDRIYTSRLLSLRAFRRSATISLVIWLLLVFGPVLVALVKLRRDPTTSHPMNFYLPIVIFILGACLFTTVLSDYLSLPFVRRFLRLAQTHPIRAMVTSSVVGLLVIIIIYLIIIIVLLAAEVFVSLYFYFDLTSSIVRQYTTDTGDFYKSIASLSDSVYMTTAAFIIHLWLPLFALSSLFVKLVFWIFRAVEKAQWFLKQGDAHPFRAIGIVATIIVFGSAMLVKEAWTYL
jgi:hypothetical protein